jgi:3-isopropylmalate dehydrogenase
MDHGETTTPMHAEVDAENAILLEPARTANKSLAAAPIARKTLSIAVLPGDGIGPEVMAEAIRVLEAVCSEQGPRLELISCEAGAGEYLRSGEALPLQALEACRKADAILLGAMGLPDVRLPDGREIAPQIDLREQLDLYCGLRPAQLYHPADSPLKGRAGQIDLLIIRENTEGLFSARHARQPAEPAAVEDIMRITRRGSERLFRAAFRIASQRRKKLTLVDKANVLPSMVLFRAVFDEVAAEFPDVAIEKVYVDAAALYLVQRPQTFDCIVTENMFGDILSDLAAGLVGGMGLAPSADIGECAAMFQPAHGTAPDIAGRGIANPIAMILSAAQMLEWLADSHCLSAAARIRAAVAAVLSDHQLRTADLGGLLTTREMADAVLSRL